MPYEEFIRVLAHKYWNFNEIPSQEYLKDVADYLLNHPEEFKGARPQ